MKKSQRQQLLEASAEIDNPRAEITMDSLKVRLRKVVKQAKRTYYQKVINELDKNSIFGAINGQRTFDNIPHRKFNVQMDLQRHSIKESEKP